jgi:hypothetical protein
VEAWDEKTLLSMLRDVFAVDLESISEQDVHEMRAAVDGAKGNTLSERRGPMMSCRTGSSGTMARQFQLLNEIRGDVRSHPPEVK